jgi:hypothetical protein
MLVKSWREIKSGIFMRMLDDPKKDLEGGAGGGGSIDYKAEYEKSQVRIKELEASGKKSSKKSEDDEDEEEDQEDLNDRIKKRREEKNLKSSQSKDLEKALKFDFKLPEFLKTHEALLPKDFPELVEQANKEGFDDAIEKAAALKAAMIKSFFSYEENVALLTPGQKSELDEFQKLTKNSKQEKAHTFYDMIFEPALEMLKRERKAIALSKGHGGNETSSNYKKRLMDLSKKHYRVGEAK